MTNQYDVAIQTTQTYAVVIGLGVLFLVIAIVACCAIYWDGRRKVAETQRRRTMEETIGSRYEADRAFYELAQSRPVVVGVGKIAVPDRLRYASIDEKYSTTTKVGSETVTEH